VPVVVNYRQENVAERVLAATAGRGVDRISEVDFGGNLATILKVMREGTIVGTYASRGEEEPTLPYYPFLFANIVVRFVQCSLILGELREAGIRDLGRWSAEGRLRHPAPTILPISEIARAHELVESKRVIGKVILAL
jgi:NADPH2:quinone reductase